jgi:hypothetical protein
MDIKPKVRTRHFHILPYLKPHYPSSGVKVLGSQSLQNSYSSPALEQGRSKKTQERMPEAISVLSTPPPLKVSGLQGNREQIRGQKNWGKASRAHTHNHPCPHPILRYHHQVVVEKGKGIRWF